MSFVEFCGFLIEMLGGLFFILIMIMALISQMTSWVEERLKLFAPLVRYIALFVLFMTVVMMFTDLPKMQVLINIVSAGMWVFITNTGFPFISPNRIDFLFSFMATIFAQFFWMMYYLSHLQTFLYTISFFTIYVWLVPILATVSLSVVADTPEGEQVPIHSTHSVWTEKIHKLGDKINSIMPTISNKKND